MAKKRKMIELEDLLDEQPDPTSRDMVFVTANEERTPPPSSITEAEHMNRLERIRSTSVNVDEPLFDGETDLDMGLVKIGSEEDTQQIKKDLLQKHKKENDARNQPIVDELRGSEPEDIVEDLDLDVEVVPLENVERKEIKKANSKAVQEILDDLHVRR